MMKVTSEFAIATEEERGHDEVERCLSCENETTRVQMMNHARCSYEKILNLCHAEAEIQTPTAASRVIGVLISPGLGGAAALGVDRRQMRRLHGPTNRSLLMRRWQERTAEP